MYDMNIKIICPSTVYSDSCYDRSCNPVTFCCFRLNCTQLCSCWLVSAPSLSCPWFHSAWKKPRKSTSGNLSRSVRVNTFNLYY